MKNQAIIDVREADEFEAESIPGSIHVPLADFQQAAAQAIAHAPKDRKILLMCRSGKRAQMALEHAAKLGLNSDARLSVFEGGILKWKKMGFPTEAKKENHFPIMRQVQMIAGLLMLTSVALGYYVSPGFLFIGAFVGAGLTTAGVTGFCGMARLLVHAPWNQIPKT